MKESKNAKKLPGFYIALCCCVIAIGVAGFIAQDREISQTNTPAVAEVTLSPVIENNIIEDEDFTDLAKMDEMPTQVPDVLPIEEYAVDNPDVAPVSVVVQAEESCQFSDPIADMTILYGYVTDTLGFNEVYGDWRTHNGIDIAAAVGCSVNAVSQGTVIDVIDTSYGKTVKIEHTGGFVSVYSQLGEVNVKVGDTVDTGAVIGTVGESVGENVKESHLHYELHKDGKPVNPQEY